MEPSQINALAAPLGMALLGALHEGGRTIYLLGPDTERFWPLLQTQPERHGPDPVDTYSRRVLTDLSQALGGDVRFPFDTPAPPFLSWAVRAGCAVSPVQMLVHPSQGLWVSFRGALILPGQRTLPGTGPVPCDTCPDQPCRSACPVEAFASGGYDLAACHRHLDQPGNTCMSKGCAARRACPSSPMRPDVQSAHHMTSFHP